MTLSLSGGITATIEPSNGELQATLEKRSWIVRCDECAERFVVRATVEVSFLTQEHKENEKAS